MKKIILSSVISLVVLCSVSVASAQNPKISNPDKGSVDLSCQYNSDGSYTVAIKYVRLTGLGNATSVTASLTAVATADVNCYNSGQLKKEAPIKSMPGQSSTTTGDAIDLTPQNGVLIIRNCTVRVDIVGDCKNTNPNNGFDSEVVNVNISNLYVTISGKQVSLRDYISQLDNCEGICK